MLIEQYIEGETGLKQCGDLAQQLLQRTSHLVKARSVAIAATRCAFMARLVETFGVSGGFASVIPGKGVLVHQILSLAFLDAFEDFKRGNRTPLEEYVEKALEELENLGVFGEQRDMAQINSAKRDAIKMLRYALEDAIQRVARDIGLELENAKAYTEFQLMSYRYHVWGVMDAIVEDPLNKRAIIIDWKTGRNEDRAPSLQDPDIAQAYVYALLEAERLGFEDYDAAKDAITSDKIVSFVIRPIEKKGRLQPIYTLNPVYPEARERRFSVAELLDRIVLAAEHLTLLLATSLQNISKDDRTLLKVCSSRANTKNILRHVPKALPKANPRNNKFPCIACPAYVREACIFYLHRYELPLDIDKRAWRTRFAIYTVRENALKPYKEVYQIYKQLRLSLSEFFKEFGRYALPDSGNRADEFEEVEIYEGGEPVFVLKRKLRTEEEEQDRPITVREGKPVAVFFHDANVADPLMRLTFAGRVDETRVTDDMIEVFVSGVSLPSKLQAKIISKILNKYRELCIRPIALETNVDLTQIELSAIDAYQRGTYKKLKVPEMQELKETKEKTLEILFGTEVV